MRDDMMGERIRKSINILVRVRRMILELTDEESIKMRREIDDILKSLMVESQIDSDNRIAFLMMKAKEVLS